MESAGVCAMPLPWVSAVKGSTGIQKIFGSISSWILSLLTYTSPFTPEHIETVLLWTPLHNIIEIQA